MDKESFFFPYENIRPQQSGFIKDVQDSLKNRQHLLAHAPTGLGKTVAVLCPSLIEADKKDLTIFFLTSRHTQQKIVIDTIREITKKYKISIQTVSMLGKKWMCAQDNVESFPSKDFADYCKTLRDNNQCLFYSNTKKENNSPTIKAKENIERLQSPLDAEEMLVNCKKARLCPYEMSLLLAKKARIIIADYYYIFHPTVSEHFLTKVNKEIEKSIIIVDEGHNLGNRMRDLSSAKLSSFMIKSAIQEAKKYGLADKIPFIVEIQDFLTKAAESLQAGQEKIIQRAVFMDAVSQIEDYEEVCDLLSHAGDLIREETGRSFLAGVASFLEAWQGDDLGFVRVLSLEDNPRFGPIITLSYSCLDPSILTNEIIEKSYSTLLISGTLTPTGMYKDLLGFNKRINEKIYTNPFDAKNRLSLVIPETTTQYKQRSPQQYREIANICSRIVNSIPGNTALFFPSYALRNEVYEFFEPLTNKPLILEQPGSKQQRKELFDEFISHRKKGATLLGVTSGSFGEGVDFPGDFLKGVVVIGLPLNKPDLTTQALIKYYDQKFNNGWDYGYVLPAITKVLQNAGRCIRSETDRGVIAFVDKRYAWPNYFSCFPKDWNPTITLDFESKIRSFFGTLG